MKILVVHYNNPVFKDDTDVFCEGLADLGHDIIKINFMTNAGKLVCEPYDIKELESVDLIWAPYEIEICMAEYFKKLINKPIVGHYEWVAPWRVGEEPVNWGYDIIGRSYNDLSDTIIDFHKKRYGDLIEQYFSCDVKTYADPFTLKTIEKFSGEQITDAHVKPYVIDDKLLLSQKNNTIEQKYQIMSTARLVPHKKVHHIIMALSKVRDPPAYKIIGEGPEKENLIALAKKLDVDVEFCGYGQKGDKAKIIQESLFSVNIWAGLPTGESAIFKKHSIIYEHEAAVTASGGMSSYAQWNNIDDLALHIQYLLDNPQVRKKLGEESYKSLMSGENGIKPTKHACLGIEKIFKEALK